MVMILRQLHRHRHRHRHRHHVNIYIGILIFIIGFCIYYFTECKSDESLPIWVYYLYQYQILICVWLILSGLIKSENNIKIINFLLVPIRWFFSCIIILFTIDNFLEQIGMRYYPDNYYMIKKIDDYLKVNIVIIFLIMGLIGCGIYYLSSSIRQQ